MPAQLMRVCMHRLYICVSLSLVMHCHTYMPRLYTSHPVTSLDSPSEASAMRSFRNSQDSDCEVMFPSTADTRKVQCTTRTRRSLCRTSATAECVVTIYFRKIQDYTNKNEASFQSVFLLCCCLLLSFQLANLCASFFQRVLLLLYLHQFFSCHSQWEHRV